MDELKHAVEQILLAKTGVSMTTQNAQKYLKTQITSPFGLIRFSCPGWMDSSYQQVALMLGELSFADPDEPITFCGMDIVGFTQDSGSLTYSPSVTGNKVKR